MSSVATVGRLVVTVTGDVEQLKVDMREAQTITGNATKEIVNGLQGVTDATYSRNEAGKRMIAALKEELHTFGMSADEVTIYKASLLGVGDEAARLLERTNAMKAAQASFTQEVAATGAALRAHGAAANEAGGHVEGFSFKTAGAKRELLVLAHELSQGNYKKFGGSMLVLGEQTGAAGLLFSAAGIAAIGMGAAIIGVGVAISHGASEQKAMNDALITTGNYAGVTSDALNSMAHAAVTSGGSLGEAKKAATELAASGKFTGDQIGSITTAVVAMEHATGASIDETIKQFESLAVQAGGHSARASTEISQATIKLDQQYHFLTLSVYDQITALEKEGDLKGASRIATEEFARVTKDRAEEIIGNLGYVAKAWNAVKESISGAGDAIGNLGKKSTEATEVLHLQTQLSKLQGGTTSGLKGPSNSAWASGAIAETTAALAVAQEKLNKANEIAAAMGSNALTQSNAVQAAQRVDAMLIRAQTHDQSALTTAMKEYHEQLDKIRAASTTEDGDPRLSSSAIKAAEAAITRMHTKPTKVSDDSAQILADKKVQEQTLLDQEKNIYDERITMLKTYHDKLGLSNEDFYAGSKNARDAYIAGEAASNARQKQWLDEAAAAAKNPKEVAAAQTKYDELTRAHQNFLQKIGTGDSRDALSVNIKEKESLDDYIKLTDKSGQAAVKSLNDQIAKETERGLEIGKSKSQIDALKQAQQDAAAADMQNQAAAITGLLQENGLNAEATRIYTDVLSHLNAQIAARKILTGVLGENAVAQAALESANFANKQAEQAIQDWKNVGKSISESLSSAFGSGGKALGDMFKAYADNSAEQMRLDKQMAEAKNKSNTDPEKLKAIDNIRSKSTDAQLKQYGDMASAAKGFFDKNTAGYKLMDGLEKEMRLLQLANQAEKLYTSLFVSAASATGVVKGQAVETAAVGTAQSAQNAAKVPGVFMAFMSAMGPWGAAAAAVAVAAVLGGAFSGDGGTDTTSKDRQAANGTGSVLGDSSAKSASIQNSLDILDKNSGLGLVHSASMMQSLKEIVSGIGGLTTMLVSGTNLTAPVVATGSSNFFSKLGNSIFGGNTSVVDSGISIGKTTLGGVATSGVNSGQYTDTKTDGGWFSSDKYATQFAGFSSEINGQFAKIFTSMGAAVSAGADILGLGGDEFSKKLSTFVIDFQNFSTKGMTGDEIQKALEAQLSKIGDDMAKFAIAGLDQFQKVGVGYLETLARVANDYTQFDDVLAVLGQGMKVTGLAAVKLTEDAITAAGGLATLTTNTGYFVDNFLTEAEKMAPIAASVKAALNAIGEGNIQSMDDFKTATLDAAAGMAAGKDGAAGLYAALVAVAPQFKQISDYAAELSGIKIKSASEIRSERDDLQKQYDSLTLTPAQQTARDRASIDASNLPLFDSIQAENALHTAIAESNTILGIQGQIYAANGDKVSAAIVLEIQHKNALIGMSAELANANKTLWAIQADEKSRSDALVIYNGLLSIQSQIYALNNNKVSAAIILEAQHTAALAAMDPALRAATVTLWGLQKAAADLADQKTVAAGLVTEADNAFAILQKSVTMQKDLLTKAHDLTMKNLQTQIDAQTKLQTTAKALSDALKTAATAAVPLTRVQAQAQIDAALATQRAGGALDLAKLQPALTALTTDASLTFKSMEDFQRDAYQTADTLGQLSDGADNALDIATKTLDTLNKSKDAEDAAYAAANLALDDVVKAGQLQLDALKGMDTHLISVQQAIENLTSAVLHAAANPINAATSAIGGAYTSALGRPADAAGLAYWQGQSNAGGSTSSIVDAITNSPEAKVRQEYQLAFGRAPDAAGLQYWVGALNSGTSVADMGQQFLQSAEFKSLHPSLDVGTNFLPGDMTINAHEGERVIPAADNRELMSRLSSPQSNSVELVLAVKALQAENVALRKVVESHLFAIAKSTRTTADLSEKNDVIGIPATRTGP